MPIIDVFAHLGSTPWFQADRVGLLRAMQRAGIQQMAVASRLALASNFAEGNFKLKAALEQAGASLQDVVRTRIYVVRLDDWRAVARAHGEVFGQIRPANTLVQVAGLVDGGPLVEIEADAIIQR